MKKKYPLVSVLIPNYNYGHYLNQCLESVLNQTYPNYEVIFRDNDSTDNSYEIAMSYYEKFKEKGIYYSAIKNKNNVGSFSNSCLCIRESEADFIIYLSSDDYLEPTFLEKCMEVMLSNTNIGMVMTHRNEVDNNGNMRIEPPFYNKSCIVDGEAQAAVFMMAGIAVPSQVIYRKSILVRIQPFMLSFQVAGDWYQNFLVACFSDVGYIKEPLCNYRVHSGNETTSSEKNLLGIFEHYQLINAFKSLGERLNIKLVVDRYEEAVKKLSTMCLRYALKMFKDNKKEIAEKYLFLANVFDSNIVNNKDYIKMKKWLLLSDEELIKTVKSEQDIKRMQSYNPPVQHIEIKV